LKPAISEIIHPILLSNPKFQKKISSSTALVDTLYNVILANLDEE